MLPKVSEHVQHPLVDSIFSFVSSKKNVETVMKWCEEGKIEGYTLNKSHKNSILKVVFRSKDITLDAKNALLAAVQGDDISDLAQNTKLTCMASLPDPAVKA